MTGIAILHPRKLIICDFVAHGILYFIITRDNDCFKDINDGFQACREVVQTIIRLIGFTNTILVLEEGTLPPSIWSMAASVDPFPPHHPVVEGMMVMAKTCFSCSQWTARSRYLRTLLSPSPVSCPTVLCRGQWLTFLVWMPL